MKCCSYAEIVMTGDPVHAVGELLLEVHEQTRLKRATPVSIVIVRAT